MDMPKQNSFLSLLFHINNCGIVAGISYAGATVCMPLVLYRT